MMDIYIVKASNQRHQWISGIFKEEQEVLNYIDSIPNDLKNNQIIIELPNTNYKHEHVTNDFIGWYKRKGNGFLIQRGIL